jgi:hypothetical protein
MRSSLVYYRVYTERGALLSKSSAETGDPSVGRVLGRSVPPPLIQQHHSNDGYLLLRRSMTQAMQICFSPALPVQLWMIMTTSYCLLGLVQACSHMNQWRLLSATNQ